jgi:hypothetical protein
VTLNVDLKDYSKAKISVTKDNFELIKEVEHFEELQVDEEHVIHLNHKIKFVVVFMLFISN